jgi:hypothetical protein
MPSSLPPNDNHAKTKTNLEGTTGVFLTSFYELEAT